MESNVGFLPIHITATNTNLPISSGLGSSASFNVAVATAFMLSAHIIDPILDTKNKRFGKFCFIFYSYLRMLIVYLAFSMLHFKIQENSTPTL